MSDTGADARVRAGAKALQGEKNHSTVRLYPQESAGIMVEEREFSAAPPRQDAQGAFGHAGALTALVEEACALPVAVGAFVAVWEGGNLLCQAHAHLQRISAWTALATCQFINRRDLRRIFVTQSGTRHVEIAHLDTGNPTPQVATELALLAFRRIQHPFAAVTFGDHSDRLRGVLLVTCTNDSAPTTADLDVLDRMAARASRQIGLHGHMTVGGDGAIDTARSVPPDPELMRPVDSSLGVIGAWELNDCRQKGEQFDETAFVPSEERRQRIRVPGRAHTDADNSVAYSRPRLPLIPDEACHPFHGNAATDSTATLPPWQAG